MEEMKSGSCSTKIWRGLLLLLLAVTLSSCGPAVSNVRFKVNSEPEGAHLVYCLNPGITTAEQQEPPDWIYLGNTPFNGIRRIDEEQLTETSKISLKVMRAGYFDQVKEWDGPSFLRELKANGQIFWTPRLVSQ